MTSRSILVIMLSTFALTAVGCGKSLEDLVRINRPKDSGFVPFEGQASIKVSPGTTLATSADVSMQAHITITNRSLTGSDVSATVSVSHQRIDGWK